MLHFNRRLKQESRAALWQFLKERWQLSGNFEGVPIADRLMGTGSATNHVSLLWEVFTQVASVDLDQPWQRIESELLERLSADR